MDITYPPEAEAYRMQIRTYLSSVLPQDWQGIGAIESEEEREAFRASWREEIGRAGLIAPSWPKEYGGAGLTQIEQVVLAEELSRAGAPEGFENDVLGIKLLGNTIVELGSEETKTQFLPRILSGEYAFCQGFSEPEAGSDLAGMRTRAVRDGDDWILNGQKTWTSGGLTANWMFVVARTDPSQVKHKGLTFFLLDMNQPGVEVRPIVNAAGHAAFAEVFFTDARISGKHVVGAVNDGWRVTNTLLGFERGVRVTTDAIRFGNELHKLAELVRERGLMVDPHIRAELAWCESRVNLIKYRGYRALTRYLDGEKPGVDGSLSKLIWSEYLQRYTEIAMSVLGLEALTPTGAGNGETLVVPEAGTPNSVQRWIDVALYARAATVYGGSAQIQRNIIGERLLGLPKEPRLDDGPFSPVPAHAATL